MGPPSLGPTFCVLSALEAAIACIVTLAASATSCVITSFAFAHLPFLYMNSFCLCLPH